MRSPLTSQAKALRRRLTKHEAKVWLHLREWRSSGIKFRRQVPLGPFIVDFACFHPKLIVEIDGGQHTLDGHARRDAQRDAWLKSQGFTVFRAWNHEVHNDISAVMDGIMTLIEDMTGPPSP